MLGAIVVTMTFTLALAGFKTKFLYVMGNGLSGELSCTWTGMFSHFSACPKHISESIKGNEMKFHKLLKA